MTPEPPAVPAEDEIRRLLERVDELIKYAGNRADPDVAYRGARLLVEEAQWHTDDIADPVARDALVVQVGRRRDDLNRLLLDQLGLDDDGPEPPAGPLAAPDPVTLARPRRVGAERIPPNQRLVTSFPVLHTGRPPRTDLRAWRFRCRGLVERELVLTWDEFRALPRVQSTSDFHCVTGWSRLENVWEGVRVRDVAEACGVRPEATHAIVHGHHRYTANADLPSLLADDVLLAWSHDGAPLSVDHGGPLRLVLPSRYAWKSVKWAEGIVFLDHDVAGYWEARGYHNVADPFLEQRYA